jgi:hypothetical protein
MVGAKSWDFIRAVVSFVGKECNATTALAVAFGVVAVAIIPIIITTYHILSVSTTSNRIRSQTDLERDMK